MVYNKVLCRGLLKKRGVKQKTSKCMREGQARKVERGRREEAYKNDGACFGETRAKKVVLASTWVTSTSACTE